MQLCQNNWEPVAFLSVKLSKSQQKWSTYDRELLAMYISVKRFRHMLEGRDFIIYTDQKPLMYAFMQNPDKCSPRQWRHLDFISQFSTDVRHINGTHNAVADALSRIEVNQISNSFLDFEALSKAQLEDNELQSFQNDEKSSLVFKRVPSPISATELICDTSTGSPRPFVPHNFRRTIFEHFHNLAHPGVAASFQLITSRYVWPNMRKTVKDWVQNCIACQRSKVHRHIFNATRLRICATVEKPHESFKTLVNIHSWIFKNFCAP
ncbi:transposon Tf2-11 polyprotein [Trichonephila clavipes]|nr:transposon Tf2-11 polyprotein [Trichonephila clavipes]